MSTSSRMSRSLAVLRDCGPYVFIELVLPGGTLFALLLYLSRRFMRGGFVSVRQHAMRRIAERVAVRAKPRPGRTGRCMCPGHTAVVTAGEIERRCETRTSLPACCCA